MEEIVRLVDLPFGIVSFTLIDSDGIPNIYINARQSKDMQRIGYEHEKEHIRRDDWNSDLPVYLIEQEVRNAI